MANATKRSRLVLFLRSVAALHAPQLLSEAGGGGSSGGGGAGGGARALLCFDEFQVEYRA